MSESEAATYVGGELGLFEHVTTWKQYFASQLRPFLRGSVLEVGAGIGGTTELLCGGSEDRWVCLEPDPKLVVELHKRRLPPHCQIVQGTLESLPATDRFQAVLYLDVLEHIEDDRGELARAAERIAPGGALLVLAPAHPWLYSPFDAAIGHHRRYTRRSLAAVGPAGLKLERLRYLDAVGLLASAGNRLLLRRSMPELRQLMFWDRCLVPLSKILDPVLGFRLGKSVLAVWLVRGGPASSPAPDRGRGGPRVRPRCR